MSKPNTVDEYLRALPQHQRQALKKLRAQIKAAAHTAEEHIESTCPNQSRIYMPA